jgi:carboxyl-terminal processing protease
MNGRAWTVAIVLGASVVSGGWLVGHGLQDETPVHSGARLFDNVAEHVRRYYVDSLSDSTLYERAAIGMLRELQDPYTLYLSPPRLRRVTERATGNYVGIGAQIQRRDEWPLIVAPFPGSPAERAGLHTGDRLVQIDGRSTRGWTVEETIGALRGEPGTTVSLVVERPGDPRRLALRLTRGGIHRRSVARTALLREQVGYVDLNLFNDSTERELRTTIDSLIAAGMRGLVLDLRGNPGGVLQQGVSVADLFLDPPQVIMRTRGRAPEANAVFADSSAQPWPTLPLVVLVDGVSASAAEIVAGALQDHDRAVLMGRTSFGKGSAQSVFRTASGGAVKLTTARWYTPLGRSIDRPRDTRGIDDDADSVKATEYKTPRGRVVYGGGGIVPDIPVGDTIFSPAEEALEEVLGTRVSDFRDAMVDYAIRLKERNAITSRDFVVTPAMLDGLWQTMRGRGFAFDRAIFDGASSLVGKLLGREIARYHFGPQAEAERAIREDAVIQAAVRLAAGASSQQELFERVPARRAAPPGR